jgi:protein TonB
VSLLLHGILCAASVDHLIRPVVETPKVRVMSMDLSLIEAQVKPETPPVAEAPPDPVRGKNVRPKTVTPSEPIPEKQTVPLPEPDPIPAPVAETGRVPDEPVDEQKAATPKDIQSFQARVQQAFPLYQDNPPPDYPALARKRNWEGRVELDVLVGRDGRVMDLKVERSSGYSLLDRSALKSVSQWHFEPGKRGDERLDMWVRVPVVFRLGGA